MKVAFYKAFCDNATLLDNLIGIASLGKYSHVELVFSNGESFSSSPRDGEARFTTIDYHKDRWEMVEINIPKQEEARLYRLALTNIGKKYDYIGAIFSVLPVCIQNNDKIFCSEVITNLLNQTVKYRHIKDGCNYSPSELYNEL